MVGDDGVRRVRSGPEDDTGFDPPWNIVVLTLVVVAERIVRHPGSEPRCSRPGCRLDLL